MANNDHRKEIEGYLIKRLNPLINSSKRNGFYKRSFIEKKPYSIDFWLEVEELYRSEVYQYGDSETIFHVGDKKWVKRNSENGHDAEEIQFGRSFDTWCKKNNIENRMDEWKEDREAFYHSVTTGEKQHEKK